MTNKLLNGFNNGIASQYKATNGVIKPMYIIGLKSKIYYNTRHFKNVFFKDPIKDVIAVKL
jgi:hypothetical protein